MRSAASGNMTEGSSTLDISYRYDVRGQLLEERWNGDSVCCAYDRAGTGCGRKMHLRRYPAITMRRTSCALLRGKMEENVLLMTGKGVY